MLRNSSRDELGDRQRTRPRTSRDGGVVRRTSRSPRPAGGSSKTGTGVTLAPVSHLVSLRATGPSSRRRLAAMTRHAKAVILLAVCTGGCGRGGDSAGSAAHVTGTVTYRERMELPADAVLEITLQDVSKADAAAEVVGSTRIRNPGAP